MGPRPKTSPGRARAATAPGPWIPALAVFVFFSVVYGLTAQRGFSWQDSGEFQYRVVVGDYLWNYGIALAHPGYIFLARLFARAVSPLFGAVFATTLFSSVGMAAASAFLVLLLMALTGRRRAAVVAAAALGLAHMAWWMGTMAEVYGWSLAFLFAELLALAKALRTEGESYAGRRCVPWAVLFLLNGLHLSFHNFALLDLAVYLPLMLLSVGRKRLPGRLVPAALGAFAVGAAPVLVLAVLKILDGASLPAVLSSVLFGEGHARGESYARVVLGADGIPWRRAFANLALAALSLLTPVWLFAGRGFREGLRGERPLRTALLALTALHFLFWIRYFVPDQATFVLPSLGLLALWSGLGIASAPLPRRRLLLLAAAGAAVQLVAPLLLAEALHAPAASRLIVKAHRVLPYRDEADYWVLPWKSEERSAELFAGAVDSQLEDGGIVYADSTAAPPLMLTAYLSETFPKWELYTPWNKGGADFVALGRLCERGGPPLYVVTPRAGYVPDELLRSRQYGFLRQGALYRAIRGPLGNLRRPPGKGS